MKTIILFLFTCICFASLEAQQIYKPRPISKLDKGELPLLKNKKTKTIKALQFKLDSISKAKDSLQIGTMQDSSCCNKILEMLNTKEENSGLEEEVEEEDEYPKVSILGSGSLSGNADTAVAKSGKLHVLFFPTERWCIYGAINRGFRTDTLDENSAPPARNLLFPDDNVMGYQLGISHSLRLKTWEKKENRMDLVFVPFAEYMLQKRTFVTRDTINATSRSFFASNLFIGGGLELNYFKGKNSVSIDFKGGYTRLNVANNDVDDFRGVYSPLINQTGINLDDNYTGLFFQSAIKINGAGLFYKYAKMNAGNDLTVKGLTGGQHFFGIILSTEVWKN